MNKILTERTIGISMVATFLAGLTCLVGIKVMLISCAITAFVVTGVILAVGRP